MRPWILAEINYGFTKTNRYDVAVLPLGATEPHNLHLPYGTDVFEGTIVGERICEEAWRRGGKVVLLPTIPFGTETNLAAFPLAINVNPSTLFAFVTDVIDSLVHSGIRKIVLLNSHGGNDLKPLLREIAGKSFTPSPLGGEGRAEGHHVFLCNWYNALNDIYHNIFQEKEDHAGEMETSFGLAFFPELVGKGADGKLIADQGTTNDTKFEAINRGWVSITRPWHLLTSNSGSGNPHHATAEKGQLMMQHLVDRLGGFLHELAMAKVDERFPF